MCLWAQGIDNDDGGVSGLRRALGLSDEDRGIIRGRGLRDAPEGLETTTEAAGARRRAQVIYDGDRGVGGGI